VKAAGHALIQVILPVSVCCKIVRIVFAEPSDVCVNTVLRPMPTVASRPAIFRAYRDFAVARTTSASRFTLSEIVFQRYVPLGLCVSLQRSKGHSYSNAGKLVHENMPMTKFPDKFEWRQLQYRPWCGARVQYVAAFKSNYTVRALFLEFC